MGGAERVHAIEWAWWERFRDARIFLYRLPAEPFEIADAEAGYYIARSAVRPIERTVITDVIQKHADLGIELRVVENLWPLWDLVIASTLCFSGIRLRNAAPRPTTNRLADGRRPYTLHWFDTFGSPPGAPGTGEWQGNALTFHQEGSGMGKHRRSEAGAEPPRRASLNRIV